MNTPVAGFELPAGRRGRPWRCGTGDGGLGRRGRRIGMAPSAPASTAWRLQTVLIAPTNPAVRLPVRVSCFLWPGTGRGWRLGCGPPRDARVGAGPA